MNTTLISNYIVSVLLVLNFPVIICIGLMIINMDKE